jgi:uncharacterized protein (TIGR02996 family)
MTEEDVFVHAILTEPDDHVHRHVYADWLLDHDPPREPFVRRQALLGPSVRTGLGQRLVPLPPGTFRMGSPDDEHGRDPDEPAHEVKLTRPFYLGATPVTVGQFRAFALAAGYETQAERAVGVGFNRQAESWEQGPGYSWRWPGWKQADDEPVVCLSWEDARAFCAWLGESDGRRYRLPTEAEWEYACRAGTTTPFFNGLEVAAEEANYNTTLPYVGKPRRRWVGQTTPVGRYPANAWGLFDMHGNAWEWCSDWYDYGYYRRGRKTNPPGAPRGFGRVLRGGSWFNAARDCRSALRRCGNPFYSRYRDGNTGFRLALSNPLPGPKPRRWPPRKG